MNKETLSKIVQISTIIPLILIFIGAIKLFGYYNSFNINIGQYIRTQELLTLFFSDLLIYLILGITTFVMFIFTYSIFNVKYDMTLAEIFQIENFWKRFIKYLDVPTAFFIVLGLSLLILSSVSEKFNYLKVPAILLFLLGISVIIMNEFCKAYINLNGKEVRTHIFKVYNFVVPTLVFLAILIGKGYFEIENTKRLIYFGTEIITKDKVYKSDSTINYLGKTMDFYFFHNLKDNSNIIIPSNSIISTCFKEKKLKELNYYPF